MLPGYCKKYNKLIINGILLWWLLIHSVLSREINLFIEYKQINFIGKIKQAITVNNQIPGPALYFKQGEHVSINVYNKLNKPTSIHWHGVLVPWQMDGVFGVNQAGIPPGGVYHYKFNLLQAGTYWYHAHTGLQEQEGLYGAFIIEPQHAPSYYYDKDYTIVLSEWSNTHAEQIMANLKKDGDYYAPNFPLQPSLFKFIHDYRASTPTKAKQLVQDYITMQRSRMGLYDINDVAYDAFLLNGHTELTPWTALVQKGDRVRLRFIGASASTIFRIKIPNHRMQVVHVDGNDIRPYFVSNFTLAPGETYDVIVNINKNEPTILYVESTDKVGVVYGALLTKANQYVAYKEVIPFPEPLPVTRNMQAFMMGKKQHGFLPNTNGQTSTKLCSQHEPHTLDQMHSGKKMQGMQHDNFAYSQINSMRKQMHMLPSQTNMSSQMRMSSSSMTMPTEPSIIGDHITLPQKNYVTSCGTKYHNLIAAIPTNDPDKPIAGTIKLELFGYMNHFIWFINGLPAYRTQPIKLESGKRYRFIFTNRSMMHHPMHIHGHWFILRTGNDAYDPLLHTIDIAPGSIITADVDTDASGQWFFHCHMLYHMVAGMSRVFQYYTLLEVMAGKIPPERILKYGKYLNRPAVKVDAAIKPIAANLVKHPEAHAEQFWTATYLAIGNDFFHNAQELTYKGLYGNDYHKLELYTNDAQTYRGQLENADIDIFYWHLVSQFWAIKGGINYFNQPAQRPYLQIGLGVEGMLPYFINVDLRNYFYNGSMKLDLEISRDTQISNNFFISAGVRSIVATKTIPSALIGSSLNEIRYTVTPYYRLAPGISIYLEYELDKNYGAFKNLELAQGEVPTEITYTLGMSFIF